MLGKSEVMIWRLKKWDAQQTIPVHTKLVFVSTKKQSRYWNSTVCRNRSTRRRQSNAGLQNWRTTWKNERKRLPLIKVEATSHIPTTAESKLLRKYYSMRYSHFQALLDDNLKGCIIYEIWHHPFSGQPERKYLTLIVQILQDMRSLWKWGERFSAQQENGASYG